MSIPLGKVAGVMRTICGLSVSHTISGAPSKSTESSSSGRRSHRRLSLPPEIHAPRAGLCSSPSAAVAHLLADVEGEGRRSASAPCSEPEVKGALVEDNATLRAQNADPR